MDEEFRKQLADYFTAAELVDFLDIPVEVLIDILHDQTDYIDDNLEVLSERINYGV